jgi:hypothetical protein
VLKYWCNFLISQYKTKTLAELGKENKEFKKTNSESLRKKVQYVYNKIKLLKRKGNADVLDKYAKSTFSPPVSKLDCLKKEIKHVNCKSTTNSKSQQEILEFCFFNCQITVCGLKKINVKRKKSDVLYDYLKYKY